MSTLPLVSVVIPVYNAERYLGATLDTVFSQTYPHLEVITVDDDSSDNSRAILESYGGRLKYIHQNNAGPAAARNTGIRAAQGEYIAFIDADDQWLPEKISLQAEFMLAGSRDLALVHTDVTNIYENHSEDPLAKDLATIMPHEAAFRKLFGGNFIATSSVLCKKAIFDELDDFDESMDLFAVEDYDMWLRVACHYDIGFLPTRLLRYRIHEEGISKNIDRSYQNEGNVLDKWYRSGSVCISRLEFSRGMRYRTLMRDWGDDLAWSGRRRDAASIYLRALEQHGFSISIVFRALKLLAPRSKRGLHQT